MPFQSSQGTTFTWDGTTYKCTDISVDTSASARETVDMSTLDLADDSETVMVSAPLTPRADPKKVSITYKVEGSLIEAGVEATLATASASGTYKCTSASAGYKVNAFVEATATFEEVIA